MAYFSSAERVRKTNRDNLVLLSVGMTKSEVFRLMGTKTVETEFMTITNPYRIETLQGGDGETYEIVSYYTDRKKTDGAITDDEITPLVFHAGGLSGWGWPFLDQIISKFHPGMKPPEVQPAVPEPAQGLALSQSFQEPTPTVMHVKPPQTKVTRASVPKEPAPALELKRAISSSKYFPLLEYKKAYGLFLEHRYEEALALFQDFLQRYPHHDLSDNAQYWIGENYYHVKDYANAIVAFEKVITHYADGNKTPDALLKIGYAYIALENFTTARVFLKRVIDNYPVSEAEPKAQAKLKEIENL
jgi:tol-pal system protein YbgF